MHAFNPARHGAATRRQEQAGSSLIEFSVIAIPVLLVGLGGIELAQWFYVKQAVSLALAEAGRAGIVDHASPKSIEAAFEKGLQTLFPPTSTQTSRQRLQDALAERAKVLGAPAWQIEVLAPTAQAFHDFQDPRLPISQQTGLAAINNHYQAEQDQRNRERGWPDGRGPSSGQSIYQANTLVLRTTYLQAPLLPGMKALIRLLPTGAHAYGQHAMATAGYLPIQQEIRLVMQSHPLQWPDAVNGKVVKPSASRYAAARPAKSCQGLWCIKPGAVPTGNAGADGGQFNDIDGNPSLPEPQAPNDTGPGHGAIESEASELGVAPDDPACGVTLCCLPG